MIPKIIHQVYFEKEMSKMPKLWKRYRKLIIKIHPKWKHVLWNKENTVQFLSEHYPQWNDFITHIPILVIQADIMRYILLQHFGGWYFDLDCEPLKAIDEFNTHQILLPLEHSINYGNAYTQIGTAVLASEPQHPFWKKVLQVIWKKKNRILSLTKAQQENIISLTGPKFVNTIFNSLQKNEQLQYTLCRRENFHLPISLPLTHKEFLQIKKNPLVFSIHHSHGTWRNNNKALFRRRIVARNPFLQFLSNIYIRIKDVFLR